MDRAEIREAVLAAIVSIAPETDLQGLQPDQPLRGQIDLDSMDWINLVAALHDRLSVDIPAADYPRLATLDSAVAYLATGRAAPRRAPQRAAHGLPCTRHSVNGVEVAVRPMRRADMSLEADFVKHLSADSRYERFMVTVAELPQSKLRYLTDVDQVRHVALVATAEHEGQPAIAGVVRYIVDPSGADCEFAIALADRWQRSGLAGILMHELIGVARARGLQTMQGFVLATNSRMLKFTRQLGFRQQRDPDDRETVRVLRRLQEPGA